MTLLIVQMEQKLQYARWKAADGAKALREGRTPASGPREPNPNVERFDADTTAIPDIELSLPELPSGSPSGNTQYLSGSSSQDTPLSRPANLSNNITPLVSPRPSPGAQSRADLPSLDMDRPPGRNLSNTASGAWSTVATPGVAEEGDEDRHFQLPTVPPSAMPDVHSTPPAGEKKAVRFTGPDGAPLSPAQTHFTVDSYDAPDAPPPTTFGDSPTSPAKPPPPVLKRDDNSGSSRSTNSTDTAGRPRGDSSASRSAQPSAPRPPTGNGSGSNRASPNIHPTHVPPPPPPPSLASYPSVPPTTAHPNGLGLTSPAPSAPPVSAMSSLPPAHNNPIPKLTRKQVEQTQKHARWAVSALEFDDAETARTELRKALAILGG